MNNTLRSILAAAVFSFFLMIHSSAIGAGFEEWRGNPEYWQGPIIDAHSQIEPSTDLEKLVARLDRAGVVKCLLSCRFKQSSKDVVRLYRKYPDRIVPMAKTKTRAFMKGGKGFPRIFLTEIGKFEYKGMAEIIMWHAAKKGVGAGKAVIPPDHPRLKPFIDTARTKGWPYIAHIEFSGMDFESKRNKFMKKFKIFLSENEDIPVGLIHMGQLSPAKAASLIRAHPNLFLITSHCNPMVSTSGKQPWTRLFKKQDFKPEWKELIMAHPDRFVLAFDNVFSFHWAGDFYSQVVYWRKMLKKLPEKTAAAIAYQNAQRLWKIQMDR